MDNNTSTSKYRSCYTTAENYANGFVPIVNPQPAALMPSIFCNVKPHPIIQPNICANPQSCLPYSNLKTYWS
jgi:hypothetical protein